MKHRSTTVQNGCYAPKAKTCLQNHCSRKGLYLPIQQVFKLTKWQNWPPLVIPIFTIYLYNIILTNLCYLSTFTLGNAPSQAQLKIVVFLMSFILSKELWNIEVVWAIESLHFDFSLCVIETFHPDFSQWTIEILHLDFSPTLNWSTQKWIPPTCEGVSNWNNCILTSNYEQLKPCTSICSLVISTAHSEIVLTKVSIECMEMKPWDLRGVVLLENLCAYINMAV